MKESKENKKADSKSATKKSVNKNIPVKKTDLEKKDLKGPVKTTQSTWYKAFSMKGKVMKGKLETEDTFFKHSIKIYNDTGGLIEQQYFHESGGSQVHLFNGEGTSIGSKSINKDGTIESYTKSEFNPDGKVNLQSNIHPNDNSKDSKSIWKYDEKGNAIEMRFYYQPIDQIYSHYFQKFDERGFRTEVKVIDRQGLISTWVSYLMDDKGNSIQDTTYKPDGSIDNIKKHSYRYDDNGKMIGFDDYPDFVPDGFGETYEYEYDHNGSWIKKIIFFENIAINIVLRAITYYGEASDIEIKNNKQEIKTAEHKIIIPSEIDIEPKSSINKPYNTFHKLPTEETKWLAEGSLTPDVFNAMRYYVLKHNDMPSEITFSGKSFEAVTLMKLLQENMGAEIIHTYSNKTEGKDPVLMRYTLSFPGNDYLLQASQVTQEESNKYVVPHAIDRKQERS